MESLARLYKAHHAYAFDRHPKPLIRQWLAAAGETLERNGFHNISYLGHGQDVFAVSATNPDGEGRAIRISDHLLDETRCGPEYNFSERHIPVESTGLICAIAPLADRNCRTADLIAMMLIVGASDRHAWVDPQIENIGKIGNRLVIIDNGGYSDLGNSDKNRLTNLENLQEILALEPSFFTELEAIGGAHVHSHFLVFSGENTSDGLIPQSRAEDLFMIREAAEDLGLAYRFVPLPDESDNLKGYYAFLFDPLQQKDGREIAHDLGLGPTPAKNLTGSTPERSP